MRQRFSWSLSWIRCLVYIHTLGAVILKRRGKPSCCTQDPNKLHWADPRILYIIVTCLAVLVTKGVWCTQIWTYLQFSKLRTESLAVVTKSPRCTWIALEISLVFVSSRLKGGPQEIQEPTSPYLCPLKTRKHISNLLDRKMTCSTWSSP